MAVWGANKKYPNPPARVWNVPICISGVLYLIILYQFIPVQSSIWYTRYRYGTCTVKKVNDFPVPQPGRHLPHSPWPGITTSYPAGLFWPKLREAFCIGVGDGGGGVRYRTLFSQKIAQVLVEWISVCTVNHINFITTVHCMNTILVQPAVTLYKVHVSHSVLNSAWILPTISRNTAKHSPFKSAHDDLMSQLSGWRRHAM
jgi:hypothetical protein